MSPTDIIIVAIVLIIVFFCIKKVRSSVKEGGCVGCPHCDDCAKNNEELQKGYEEWLKKKNKKA